LYGLVGVRTGLGLFLVNLPLLADIVVSIGVSLVVGWFLCIYFGNDTWVSNAESDA
jgi:hypothetical protein